MKSLVLESPAVWSFDRLCREYDAYGKLAVNRMDLRVEPLERVRSELVERMNMRVQLEDMYRYFSRGDAALTGEYRYVHLSAFAIILFLQLCHYEQKCKVMTRESCYDTLRQSKIPLSINGLERFEMVLCSLLGLRPVTAEVAIATPVVMTVYDTRKYVPMQTPTVLVLESKFYMCDTVTHIVVTVLEALENKPGGKVLERYDKREEGGSCDGSCNKVQPAQVHRLASLTTL